MGTYNLTTYWERGSLYVRIIARSTLVKFRKVYPDSEGALKSWFYEVKHADWGNPAEVKRKYRSASVLKKGRLVFNICGNKYRLLCAVRYRQGIVFIKFIGTHNQYDGLDVEVYDGPPIKSTKKRK